MFKSIFGKMVAVFLSILVLGYLIAGFTLFYFLDRYVSSETVKTIERSCDDISKFFKEVYAQNKDNPLALTLFKNAIDNNGTRTNSMVWILRNDGGIVLKDSSGIPSKIMQNLKVVEGNIPALPDERQYKKIMSGQVGEVTEKGDFYGLFNNTGYTWLTIEKPLIYTNDKGKKELVGAVLITTPISEVNKTRSTVFNFFVISGGVSIGVSIILVYIFSRRITKPLKEINKAAKVIASGEFREQLDVKTRDEIGQLRQSFNQMVTDLRNLEEMRKGFIANVSHELRTPMTSIRGFIEGILDGTIPPEKHTEYLTVVRDETNRMNRLVNDLLDLAKMEAGEVSLKTRNFDINELIRRCIIKLESLIMQKDIQIEANFDNELTMVNADPDAIERVIINLIHNSVKFSYKEGKLIISTKRQKGKVLVSVQDFGVGIDNDELTRIWDRFYKSDKSRGKDRSGTGLGLAIVKSIVNEHGEEIWVESEPGQGAVFTFTLSFANEKEN